MFKSAPLRSKQLLVFLICVAVGVALASGIRWRGDSTPPGAALEISPSDLEFGEVWLQSEYRFRLAVRNQTSQAIEVKKLSASCNCTNLSPESFTVPPHGSVVVNGTLDLTRSVYGASAERQPFEVLLTAETSQPARDPFRWPLRGMARRVLDVEPRSIDLEGANEVIAGVSSPTVEVRITPRIPLSELKPEWASDEARIDFAGPDESGAYLLRYTPNQDLPQGPIATRVNLRTKLPDGANGPEIEIPVNGNVVPPVRLSPDRVTVENRPSSETGHARGRVYVIGLDGSEWSVAEILGAPDWLAVDSSIPGQLLLDASGTPSATETASVEVVLMDSIGGRERLLLRVSLVPWSGETNVSQSP